MIITCSSEIEEGALLISTSFGGSPITIGHTRCLLACKPTVSAHLHGDSHDIKLLVIVNGDNFLKNKHGFCFQSEDERAEIFDAFKTVDYVYIHRSDKQTIDEAILLFKPSYLLKGGDRSGPQFMPECELEACKHAGTEILYGVGGIEKASSSSDLMKRCANHYLFEKYADDWLDNVERFTQGDYPKWR